jgi:chemotaxis protein CheX
LVGILIAREAIIMSRIELLPAVLDTAAARPLADMLHERLTENEPLQLDGAAVTQLGQACLQVLLSARQAAATRNITLTVREPSEAMILMATLVGCADLVAQAED